MPKKKDAYTEGLERGRLEVISRLDSELTELEHSKKIIDRIRAWMWKNYEEYVPTFGHSEPTKYEEKFCFVEKIIYRDEEINVFADDCGQQYYFYYKDKSYSCGAYNPDYEGYIHYVVDHDKDDIVNFAERGFYGAFCKYANWEHTKVDFIFRGDIVETFDVDANDPESVYKIWKECEHRLEELWKDPEFLKSEEERKSGGGLYFSELIEKMEKEESGN